MNSIVFTYVCEGNSQFYSSVAEALDETLEEFHESEGWKNDPSYFRSLAAIPNEGRYYANYVGEIFGAFSIFVVSCFAKKIFDELYERTAKRPVGAFLDRLLSRTEGKAIEIQNVIYLEDIDVWVVICAVVKEGEAETTEKLFLQAHRIAHAYLQVNGRRAAVHCHTIRDGRIDIEPVLYQRPGEAALRRTQDGR